MSFTPELRKLLKLKTSSVDTDRKALIARYRPALDLKGDAARQGVGAEEFTGELPPRGGPEMSSARTRNRQPPRRRGTAGCDSRSEPGSSTASRRSRPPTPRARRILTSQSAASVTLKRPLARRCLCCARRFSTARCRPAQCRDAGESRKRSMRRWRMYRVP